MHFPRSIEDRPVANRCWNLWRGAVGLFYVAAAIFNLAYTLPRRDEPDIFEGYAEGAWVWFLEDFMTDFFVPNAAYLIVLVILFEASVGVLVSSRGSWVDLGVGLSVAWVLLILPFLAWPYLLVNLALAALQGLLLFRRYPRPIWRPAPSAPPDAERTSTVITRAERA